MIKPSGSTYFMMWPDTINDVLIVETFPEFYKANKSKVDRGVIRMFSEPIIFEGAVLLDTETNEMIFISFK